MEDKPKLVAAKVQGGARRAAGGAGGGGRPAAQAEDEAFHPEGLDDRFQSVKGKQQWILEPDRTLTIGFIFIAIVLGFHFFQFVLK